MNLIITGSKGRMLDCASRDPECQVVGQIDRGGDLAAVIGQGDVVIDFSSHGATPGIASHCATHKKALVIGATGHSDEERSRLVQFSAQIPMVMASNFSTGAAFPRLLSFTECSSGFHSTAI